MLDNDERKMWQDSEDAEQMRYLQWQQEMIYLKNAMVGMHRMREEYRLARRVCSGYNDTKLGVYNLADALNATFMLERHSVITRPKVGAHIDAYLSAPSKKMLTAWQDEQKNFSLNQNMSPLSVAWLFARVAAKHERDVGYDVVEVPASKQDLALFFALQAEQKRWNPAIQKMFRAVAEDQLALHIWKNTDRKTLNRLIWKEMHDIIVKPNMTHEDVVMFSLVGTVGQKMGVDLEEKLLAPRQSYLNEKPQLLAIVNHLRKEEKNRHSLLGRLGLRRVRSVRS